MTAVRRTYGCASCKPCWIGDICAPAAPRPTSGHVRDKMLLVFVGFWGSRVEQGSRNPWYGRNGVKRSMCVFWLLVL